MKKFLSFVFFSFFISQIFSVDFKTTINVSAKKLDKIEFMNCTRLPVLKGYAAISDAAAGFNLKNTGDKSSVYTGDWKFISNKITFVLFDVDVPVELKIHNNGDDLYVAIVETVEK